MPLANTSSFVTQIELRVTPQQAKTLRKRFDAARMVYNACLGEYMKRIRLLRQSRDYRRYKGLRRAKLQDEARNLFRQLLERFKLRQYDNGELLKGFTKSWLNDHLGAREREAITDHAFKAVDRWMKLGFRKKGRPRFRRKGDLRSVDSKTGATIRWNEAQRSVVWKRRTGELILPAIIDERDPIVVHGLNRPVKYVRLSRKVIRGRERFFAQLVNQGQAFAKPSHRPVRGVVGVDIGMQTIAAVGESDAFLDVLCGELQRVDWKIRRLQRALDRSRRATNPHCFDEKGRWIKGERLTTIARRYRRRQSALAELQRRQAELRKNLHGQMVARLLKLGDDIRTEKLEFQSFAKKAQRDGNKRRKRFGKSVGFRAPGMLLSRLRVEAVKWGANVTEFPTKTTALSQTCVCGRKKRKGLSVRVHRCVCGVVAQRDLMSAYLARYVKENTLHAETAKREFPGFCTTLQSAWDEVKDANGLPASLGLRDRDRAPRLRNDATFSRKTPDAVPAVSAGESRRERDCNDITPHFLTAGNDSSQVEPSASNMPAADTG